MACDLEALCIDANDPARLAGFWAAVLDGDVAEDPSDGATVVLRDDTGFRLRFLPTEVRKSVQNQLHLDLTSRSLADQERTVARCLELGAQHMDVGQTTEDDHVVLADPEGNEFCVIEPGNAFLADCGLVGAVACDGSREVGLFWSEALGWPLVWDQDQETAIRSPHGGPKLTWGGPPLKPKTEKRRLHFDLAPPTGTDQQSEVDRLVALGATRLDGDQGSRVLLGDPDGNEFCVLDRPPRLP